MAIFIVDCPQCKAKVAAEQGGKAERSYFDEYAGRTSWQAVARRQLHNEALFYLLHNGTFPKPIIATAVASGLNVLDGNHRVTAHCSAQQMTAAQLTNLSVKRPSLMQEIWVGTHSGGEILAG
jgi:hypothetical protein